MNELVRMGSMPQVGTRSGDWVWNGQSWVCDPDCSSPCPAPFPPFGPPVFSGPTAQPPWYPGANGGVSFGQVAPPNPVRGHFWWDGIMLRMFDGAAFVDIGPAAAAGGGGGGGGVVPGSGLYAVTTFSSPGSFNFTIPTNVSLSTTFKFHLQAGGGGGGGNPTGSSFSAQGGGGGEYKQIVLVGPPAGQVVNCVVGAGGTQGPTTGRGGNGGVTSITIAPTNAQVAANGGFGGWGGPPSGTNNATEGTGGHGGVFTPGTSNLVLVMSVPGGDAHLPSPSDWADPGADSFLGHGQPGFDNTVGWNDTTVARGYGSGGRGAFTAPQQGGAGNQGFMIIERVSG